MLIRNNFFLVYFVAGLNSSLMRRGLISFPCELQIDKTKLDCFGYSLMLVLCSEYFVGFMEMVLNRSFDDIHFLAIDSMCNCCAVSFKLVI